MTSLDEYKFYFARSSCSVPVPHFLPQGGTWDSDVADVQWNPHPTHTQYIVSTSADKLSVPVFLQKSLIIDLTLIDYAGNWTAISNYNDLSLNHLGLAYH